jgi:hypothetical protein
LGEQEEEEMMRRKRGKGAGKRRGSKWREGD